MVEETKENKVEEKKVEEKETKKLDDLKETPENKAAIAEADEISVVSNEKLAVSSKGEGKSESAVAKVSKKESKRKGKESVIELEREYIVPLKKGVLKVPAYRRAKKAVRVLKEFMVKHMGIRDRDLRKVKIDRYLNEELWFRGIKKPANKIKVKAMKRDGIVYVSLADAPEVVKFKMARDAKRSATATEVKGKKTKAIKEEKVDTDKDNDGVDDKKEETEGRKAGAEKAAKMEKKAVKDVGHSTKGAHAQKTMPVRKVLK